jgi:hypothetical protein
VRAAARLLAEIRRFLADVSHNRIVPRLSREAVNWSELSLVLGEAESRFDRFGALFQLDVPDPPAPEAATRRLTMRATEISAGLTSALMVRCELLRASNHEGVAPRLPQAPCIPSPLRGGDRGGGRPVGHRNIPPPPTPPLKGEGSQRPTH